MDKLKSPSTSPAQPPAQRARVGTPATPRDVAVEARLQLPNERDESVNNDVAMTAALPDPLMKQAAADVARGLQDTSKAAELNRAYKKLK